MYMQDAQVYAAKRFYFIGKRDPGITNQENQKHLREEMFLATVARKCLERFTSLIIKLSINAFGNTPGPYPTVSSFTDTV